MKFGTILKRQSRRQYVARFRHRGRSFEKAFPLNRDGKAEARRWLAEQQAKLAVGVNPTRKTTFRQFVKAFAPHYRARLRPGTWDAVEFHLDTAVRFYGNKRVAEITRRDARAFLLHVQTARGVSAATLHRYAASLSSVFQAALEDDLIDSNPFLRLRLPKPDQPSRKYPAWEDVAAILAYTPKHLRPFVELVAETGLRLSEAAGLLWRDCPGDAVVVRSETAKSHRERVVPLTARAVELFRQLRRGRIIRPGDKVFQFGPDYYGRRFSRAMRDAAFQGVTMHTLRHICASRLVNRAGISIDVAQAWLGHSSIQTTRLYVHGGAEDLRAAAALLSQDGSSSSAGRKPRKSGPAAGASST